VLKEDEEGSLVSSVNNLQQQAKRRRSEDFVFCSGKKTLKIFLSKWILLFIHAALCPPLCVLFVCQLFRLKDTRMVRRGIIRHLFVVLDLSLSMEEKDLPPSRIELSAQLLEEFIMEYFDQNPISQLGVIVTRDGLAEKLTELSGQ